LAAGDERRGQAGRVRLRFGDDGAVVVPGEVFHWGQLLKRKPLAQVAFGGQGDGCAVVVGEGDGEAQRLELLRCAIRAVDEDVGESAVGGDQVGVVTLGDVVIVERDAAEEFEPSPGPG